MPTITVKLYGLGEKAGTKEEHSLSIAEGTIVSTVYERLKAAAGPDAMVHKVARRKVLASVNGSPFPQAEKWDVVLKEGDHVEFVLLVVGG